ncbi:hypothetical protein APR50_10560 [Variovorax paradoxus]|uniref:recombination protein NinB n=1 Tax=Variovorax paradoxus TaxID=34073 RepID=UPI0006E521AB|nr:hypothetical protein APR52_20810 [Variovorax paradoxus]KPV08903.1 hypothetical protein APR50_10560 [Variovorax paradoxus]KPV11400.1 hypothetical protein APR49_09435 [Variovorax paradoxus]KPV23292.1 hypothetical protein APR51_08010 [Variovorax paradoxus]KPV31142.1 hypothetical protein APR48_17595 [Variovorax paradoxus]
MTSVALINPQQAHAAITALYRDEVKPKTMAGHRLRLVLKPETRRDGQNAHLHAMIADIAEQIGGDLADPDDAKRILLSAFRIDTLKDFAEEWRKFGDLRIGRGLRGETVLMGNQTRDLSVKLASAFIEWLNAFGVEHDIRFKAPKSWGDRP